MTQVSTGNGNGHLPGRHRRLCRHRDHDDRPLLGEHRRGGKRPAFDGVLNPNSSQKELLLGPSQVDVGAGGTKVTVTSGKRTATLTPVSAPFSYQFIIKS